MHEVGRLALLERGYVGIPLHRHPAAWGVAKELLGDPRMGYCIDQETGRPVAHVVQAHGRQASSTQQRLEVLREPRTVDREAVDRYEDERVADRNNRPKAILTLEMTAEPIDDEGR